MQATKQFLSAASEMKMFCFHLSFPGTESTLWWVGSTPHGSAAAAG